MEASTASSTADQSKNAADLAKRLGDWLQTERIEAVPLRLPPRRAVDVNALDDDAIIDESTLLTADDMKRPDTAG